MLQPTVSRPVSLGIKHPSWVYNQICITFRQLLVWGALYDERTDLSFTIAAGPLQRSHSRVRVPWDSWPYFTVSDSRLPFSLPLTTRRATVEVLDLASLYIDSGRISLKTRVTCQNACLLARYPVLGSARTTYETPFILVAFCYSRMFIGSSPRNCCPSIFESITSGLFYRAVA
jgi:hypothetical protein